MIKLAPSGLGAVSLVLLVGCPPDESAWEAFNADGESVEVEVTASEELGAAVERELFSTTGAVLVGTATVDPSSGPVGTDHEVLIQVDDAFEADIARVTVETDAGERGLEEHELVQDSADHGSWWRSLTSAGDEGEERTDTFTFHLWTAAAGSDTDGAE
jgi:hypothetical protein